MQSLALSIIRFLYTRLIKKVLFLRDPEPVHARATALGERLGKSRIARGALSSLFCARYPELEQSLFGITFKSPMGLAAGFDYEARLTHVLPSLGFGFGSVGTLTNRPYGGNPRPMLGRLPRSRSLMVNKGFKNYGVEATLKRLREKHFAYPVGVSIGKTNTADITTQREAVDDIAHAFRAAEASGAPFSYYELNISCPNLMGSVEFYEPEHLRELLDMIESLKLFRPIFVKMPISKTNDEIRAMMNLIVKYSSLKAVIFGNLQRDRTNSALIPYEVRQFSCGNFSGMPCQQRSDELIRLACIEYGSRIVIIGCGGVFSAEDAYRKIKLGASLVQLITGLIFEGPQLVAEINRDLVTLLKNDGFATISDAIGKGA